MQKIYPCLWFKGNAEEAVNFYTSVFKNCKVGDIARYDEGNEHGKKGSVMTIMFQLEGQDFMALNGDVDFPYNESISLVVNCDTQAELDGIWNKMTQDGGQEVECGWLKDKFGVSWQIVPKALNDLMRDPARAQRVMAKLLTMKKLDIEQLKAA